MKNLSIILFMVLITLPIGAVKVDPQPATVVQRDGTKLTVILHGDEDFHWYTTTDNVFLAHVGYDYYVADIDDDGNLTPTMQLAHEKTDRSSQEVLLIERQMNKSVFITNANRHKKEKQQQRISIGTSTPPYLTHKGSPNILVILVQFSDLSFSLDNPQKSFQDYLNGEGPLTDYGLREDRNYGSVRQYFHDMSQGLFEPIFDVSAPITLSNSWTFYGTNITELIEESCNKVDNQIDFSKYDNDKDGYVDHISIIFAGYSGNVSGTSSYCIWPSCGELYSYGRTYDGVKVCRYGLTGELNYYPDKTYKEPPYKRINGVGVFCSVFSNTLGLPNVYPITDEAKQCDNQGMEYWDLLDIGSYTDNGYTPTPYTPWEMCVMGWADIEDLGSADRKVTLPEKKYYKIATDNDYEYLILQNLQNNNWASKMLGHGMIVYRIDYPNMFVTKDYNPNNTAGKPGITLVPADQLLISSTRVYQNESERSEAKPYSSEEYVQSFYGDPYPGTAGVTDLPIVRLNHTTITKPICNIKEENGIITFDYMKSGEPSGSVTKTVEGSTVTFLVDGAIEGEKVTADLNEQGWASDKAVDPATITLSDGTKITFDKGEGSNTPAFYDATKGVRVYAKNTITISGKAVAKVVLYCDSFNGIGYVGNSTLYGSAEGTTFVICNEFSENKGGDQLRVQKIEITYAASDVEPIILSFSASGNGNVFYNGTTIRDESKSFSLYRGASATISFTPDNGYRIGSVKVNNTDVTANVTNNQYTVSDILTNTSVSVTFADIEYDNLSNNGVNYRVVSNPNKTVNVASGSYGYWLTVPASFTANGFEWSVTGIDNDVLSNNPQLAAVIWNPSTLFTASVTNPNFLLYVTSSQYAPSAIKNVIVGNTANSITLTDASSGNNFYCPREFTARSISYSHSYGMTTGISEARGWESISLPFDVETITHSSKGTLVPFTNWQEGGSTKPFWLYQLGSGGFAEANSIVANIPYIISMPNNAEYLDEYRVSGTITFSSTDVMVKSSESLQNGTYGDRTFIPNFINQDANSGFYVLNAVNNYSANSSGYAEGSRFVRNLRTIHPFEAYIASANNAKESIPIFEDETTWIRSLFSISSPEGKGGIYDLSGRRIQVNKVTEYQSDQFPALQGGVRDRLQKGVYIVNGKKIVK